MTSPQTMKSMVRCPRCGYDLRGVAAKWADACPLFGHCSECGYEIDWGIELGSRQIAPFWLIESTSTEARGWWKAMFGTAWRLLLPWVFWRDLRLYHRVRWRRLLACMLMMFIIAGGVAYLFIQTSTAIRLYQRERTNTSWYLQRGGYELEVEPILLELMAGEEITANERSLIVRFADAQQYALDGTDNETLRIHAMRLQAMAQSRTQNVVRLKDGEVGMPLWRAIVDAIVRPRGLYSSDPTTGPGHAYPGPAYIHLLVTSPQTVHGGMAGNSYTTAPQFIARWGSAVFGGIALLMVLLPLSLALLFETRYRVQLRAAHLVRITAYGLAALSIFAAIWSMVVQLMYLTGDGPFRYEVQLLPGAGLALLGWMFLWWWMALRRYARVKHAALVAGIHIALCALFVLAGGYLIFVRFA